MRIEKEQKEYYSNEDNNITSDYLYEDYQRYNKSNGYIPEKEFKFPSLRNIYFSSIFGGILFSNLWNYKLSPIYDPKNSNYKTYFKIGSVSLFKASIYPSVMPYVIYDILVRDYGNLGGIERHFIPCSVYFKKLIKK